MKVLQLGKFYPIRGGVEKVMYDIMLGLSERGVDCDMLCASTEDHPSGEFVINEHAKLFVVNTSVKAAATMLAPAMISKLRNIAHHYDIIHVHHPDPMAALALFLSGYKGSVVLHWHSDIVKQKKLLKLYKPLQKWLIKRANIIVGTTPIYVEQSSFLQSYKHKLDYIPIGIDPLNPDLALVDSIKERFKGKFLIFSLGRLVEYKGYEYLIKSAIDLPNDYKVVIGGKGPLHNELQSLIDVNNLQDKVELLGFLSDEEAHAYFEASEVYVLSSIMKTEAFAIVQIEAMSCGTPVVTAEIEGSGVSWVNKDAESGIVCEGGNANAIAKAVRLLGEDKMLYNKLSNGARDRFVKLFHKKVMIDKTINLYLGILSRQKH